MRYDPRKIEFKWQKKWLKEKVYEPSFAKTTEGKPDLKREKKPFYNLMMFPYPSAEGLHVGNMYAFTGADIYGRFKRMQGYDVFEPIGLDGFGIHSENYALKIGKHPMEQAKISEKNFYRQLRSIGNGFSWKEKVETYDADYYRWTQWIFVQMFKRGLAYRANAPVNWCPSCKTVLADEQVVTGECERCQTRVVKKELEQWFFRITNYADRLLKNLDRIDWSERVKIAQRNWIGRSEGALIKFKIQISNAKSNSKSPSSPRLRRAGKIQSDESIEVFTTRPDTLFGATYLVVAPEHPAIKNFQFPISNFQEVQSYVKKAKAKSEEERIAECREKAGIGLEGIKAVNPANGEEIPIWVAEYVLGHVGTGAVMGVPAHDQRDFEFAKKYNLPIKMVICLHYPQKTCPVLDRAYEGKGHLVASGKFDGMLSEKAKEHIVNFVGGTKKNQYRLRDWLVSRQRYWGTPIPMIHCGECARLRQGYGGQGWQPVPEGDLPVRLPRIKDFRPTGTDESPLASVEKFYKVRCPKCKSWARRETDVSDTFLDSAWYFLRYPSVVEKKHAWNPALTKKWLPVNMYVGGAEHSVLHLFYSRFLAMVFSDWGLTDFEEPFTTFRSHGLLIKNGAKMSKSRGNVVSPDDYIRAYGADALRMYLMFLGPFERGGDFQDAGIRGITRFLERVWRYVQNAGLKNLKSQFQIQKILHRTIKKVTGDIENLQYNTAISALMILLNEFEAHADAVGTEDIKIFLKLLAPFAPHITEELFQNFFRNSKIKLHSLHQEPWPRYDQIVLQEETFELVIQVNGKVRGRISLPIGVKESDARAAALAQKNIRTHISGEPRRVIFVPNKLINFVF